MHKLEIVCYLFRYKMKIRLKMQLDICTEIRMYVIYYNYYGSTESRRIV